MGWRSTTQQRQQGQAWRLRSVHQQLPFRGPGTADMPEGTWSCVRCSIRHTILQKKTVVKASIEWKNVTLISSVHQQLPSRGPGTGDMPEALSFLEGTWSCDVFSKAYNLSEEKNSCQGSIEWKMWLGALQAVADKSSCSTAGRPLGGHMKLRTVVSRLLTPPSLPTL